MTHGGGVQLQDRVEIIDASASSLNHQSETESLELAVSSRRFWAIAAIVGLALVILLSSNRQPEQAVPVVPSTIGTGELSKPSESSRFAPDGKVNAGPGSTTAAGNVGWPIPPADRDPSYIGRPGSDDPIRTYLVDKTLLYVNDYGRPTIVDLTTGDQREVLIADGRSQDMFKLEFGRIVTTDSERSDLPLSIGRSIGVMGVRAGSAIEDNGESSIILCIDGTGCSEGSMTPNALGNQLDIATRLDSSRSAQFAIAALLGVQNWTTEHRWTLFNFDPDDPDQVLRIPTPHPNGAIWLVSQSR